MPVCWNYAAALQRLEGDEALLQDLITIFFDDYPRLSEGLNQGLAQGDLAAVRQAAHSLKGSLGYLAAGDAAALAMDIENACRTNDAAKAAELLPMLTAEVEAARQEMTTARDRTP